MSDSDESVADDAYLASPEENSDSEGSVEVDRKVVKVEDPDDDFGR